MTRLSFAKRLERPELLDGDALREDDLRLMYEEMGRLNDWLGGTSASLKTLRAGLENGRAGRAIRALEVLDVGAGSGDFLLALERWTSRRGLELESVSLDRLPEACRLALDPSRRRDNLRVVVADGLRLPFRDRAFDIAHASLLLHHLGGEAAIRLLQELRRVSRIGVVLNDLRRHRLAYYGVRLITRLMSRSPLIRHDAPVSVLRGFDEAEFRSVLQEAGAQPYRLQRRWAFRWTAWIPSGPLERRS